MYRLLTTSVSHNALMSVMWANQQHELRKDPLHQKRLHDLQMLRYRYILKGTPYKGIFTPLKADKAQPANTP